MASIGDDEKQTCLQKVLNASPGLKLLAMSALQLVSSILCLVFLYGEDDSFKQSVVNTGYFGINVTTARNIIFLTSVALLVLAVASGLVYRLSSREWVASLQKNAMSSFLDGVIYTTISASILSITFVYGDLPEESDTLVDKADGTGYLILPLIANAVMKLLLDAMHGNTYDGKGVGASLDDGRKVYESARGPAVTTMSALIIYTIVTSNFDFSTEGWEDGASSLFLLFFMGLYLAFAVMEKLGFVSRIKSVLQVNLTQALMQVLLILTGLYLGAQRSQEATFIAIGVLFVDSMQLGTLHAGQILKIQFNALPGTLYRLLQIVLGLWAFIIIRQDSAEVSEILALDASKMDNASYVKDNLPSLEVAGISDIIFAVGLAGAFVKILSILYVGKDIIKPSAEQTFRRFSTTALLLSTGYLWVGGSDFFSINDKSGLTFGNAEALFVVIVIGRVIDSILDHTYGEGKTSSYTETGLESRSVGLIKPDLATLLDYVSPYDLSTVSDGIADVGKERQFDTYGVHRPGADNIKSWFVLGGLISCVTFLGWFGHEAQSVIGNGEEVNTVRTNWTWAVVLVSLHLALVVIAILSDIIPMLNFFALSRSSAARLVVSTTVLSTLVILMKSTILVHPGSTIQFPNSQANNIIGALLSYIFADAMGADLL